MSDTITALYATKLKRRPVQSSELAPTDFLNIAPGKSYPLESWSEADNNHVKVTLGHNAGVWYIYDSVEDSTLGHWDGPWDKDVAEVEEQPRKWRPYDGVVLRMPSGERVFTDQPIIAGGSFTWGEATHAGSRAPKSKAHEANIIKLATQLQRVRDFVGVQIRVTSWYRPDPWNKAAGGAKRSQHLEGKGVDIVVNGWSGKQLGRAIVGWWPGGLGVYSGNREHILHLDVGGRRRWGF